MPSQPATFVGSTVSMSASTSSSASIASTTVISLPVPTDGTGDNGNNGLPGVSRSSSLLFGFLITFLALFVAFMACGLGSRRMMDLRRRRLGLRGAFDASTSNSGALSRPHIWDVWITDGRKDTWKEIKPLSATLMRPKTPPAEAQTPPEPAPPPPPAPPLPTRDTLPGEYFPTFMATGRGIARVAAIPPRPTATPRSTPSSYPIPNPTDSGHSFWDDIPFRIPYLSPKPQLRQPQEQAPVEGLQISVLIKMPRSKTTGIRERLEGEQDALAEYSVGVADVPWSSALL